MHKILNSTIPFPQIMTNSRYLVKTQPNTPCSQTLIALEADTLKSRFRFMTTTTMTDRKSVV